MGKIKKSVNESGRLRFSKSEPFKKENAWDDYFTKKENPVYFPKKSKRRK